jgi:predicted ribosome quality control (RQC) complex YloA/Tae2 family protein
MTLTTAEIAQVVSDLKPRLEGGRIERIDQPERHKLVLRVRSGSACYWLLLCTHPRFSRLHLLTSRPPEGKPATGFCNAVRQHLTGAPLLEVSQAAGDRIVRLRSAERDQLMGAHTVTLVAELMGVGSNLFLLDESDRVLAMLCRNSRADRDLRVGEVYVPAPPPGDLPAQALRNRFADATQADDPLALGRAIRSHYDPLESAEHLREARQQLLTELRREAKRCRRRLADVAKGLQAAAAAETTRRTGELLKTALHRVKKGMTQVQVVDLFDPAAPTVVIELDGRLSPEANLAKIFKRYKKDKAGREKLEIRAEQTRQRLVALEDLLSRVTAAESLDDLSTMRQQARGAGILPPKRSERSSGGKPERAGPRIFKSIDGLQILVSRNQRENERLTFTIGRGNDYWLHVLGWPGPHVVVRKPREGEASGEALLDAAHLAVYFSKLRGADRADVTYTQCKNVRRMKGASTGTVSYSAASTLHVRMEPERLERLLRPQGEYA